jgi:CubicO group peptidase (beta-lactamase class C family)
MNRNCVKNHRIRIILYRRIVGFLTVVMVIVATALLPITGQTTDTSVAALVANMDKHLVAGEKDGFSGAIIVVKDGKALLHKGYGFADCKRKIKMGPDMVFDIGSLTKHITSVAMLKLQAQGKLKIDDKISLYFEGVPEDKADITLLQLMSHTSGLQDVFGDDEDYVTKEWLIKKAMDSTLRFKPGVPGEIEDPYSNAGYGLLGAIIEKVSGASYEDYVYNNVLKPAGLKHTGYFRPKFKRDQVVCGFRNDKPWGSVKDFYGKTEPSWNLIAAGGMLSTVGELDKWFRAVAGNKILPKTETDLYLNRVARKGSNGRRALTPSGDNTIFSSLYVNYVDDGLSLVYFTSVDRFSVEKGFPRKLFPEFNKLLSAK